ncbi:MAG: HEAT repeat domain-containing protein [Solirubrobacteraceae bacterium]
MHAPDFIDPAELLRMLPQEDANVRLAIVRVLGNHHPEIAAKLPRAMLGDESRDVRMVLITIAAEQGDSGVLRQIASEDPDAEVRLRAGAKVTEQTP